MEQPPSELIEAAKAGDRGAQSRLYQQYVRLLFGYLYNKLGSRQVAEDICQETFLRAFKGIHTYDGRASFKNWLFQIAKHQIADYWDAHYKHATLSFEEFFETTQGAEPVVSEFLSENEAEPSTLTAAELKIEHIMNQLSREYREILEYRFLKGYSLKETAEALRITLSNAKVRQYRALLKAKDIAQTI